MTTSSSSLPKVALIGTGGTIAGVAPTPLEQISYQAGVLTVDRMLETLPGIEGVARITSVPAVITASTAKMVVPGRPKAPRHAVASSGPSTKPPLPPMENRLMPVPLFWPETALAKRAPSG